MSEYFASWMSPFRTVLLGTLLLGGVSGVVGSFAVLRRRALVGDLMAHAALPGICLAFLVLGERRFEGLLLGAFVTGLLGIFLVTLICRWTRTKEDAAIGIVLSTFFGAGIVLSTIIQRLTTTGAKAGLDTYIYGQAAGMIVKDVQLIAAASLLALVAVMAFYKEFKTLSFDAEFARAQGWPTLALDMAMMGTLAIVTVVGLPAVGVVLMAAMLITPAATARLWTNRLGLLLLLAGMLGATAGAAGTILSAGVLEDWIGFDPLAFGDNASALPTGPLIVLSGTAIFVFSLCFAPGRGWVSKAWSAWQLRSKTAHENLLRTLYELSEDQLPDTREIAVAELLRARAWSTPRVNWLLNRAAADDLLLRTTAGVRLTQRGLARARELTRRHRLWELFLIQGANIAPDHVDRDADSIEHLLPVEMVQQLEAELAAVEKRPARETTVPISPHVLDAPQSIGKPHSKPDGGPL